LAAALWHHDAMRTTLTTACPLDCPDTCTLAVTVEDGRIVDIDAATTATATDAVNPFTQDYICKKVKNHAARVYSPERILTPLIRSGAKGSGEFRAASWDEAAELVASRIRQAIDEHGVDSVLPYLYSSSAGIFANSGRTPQLFARLGAPEIAHTICASTVGASWDQVFGDMISADPFDLQHSKLVVVWGANPNASNTHLTPLLTQAAKNGATIVAIDPRRTGVAQRADLHLALQPGSDVVLAYAVTRWLHQHDRHDAAFLAAHTTGSAEFLAAAQEWTIERAADVCGLAAEDIVRFAELVAERRPAMLRMGWGLERNRNGGSSYVAALGLWLVAGHFGQRGSGVIGSTSGLAPVDLSRLWPAGVPRPEQRDLSMNDVGRALLGELEGWPATEVLFIQGANPVATALEQTTMLRGLQRDDLFTVVHEQVMTDTAVLADVILPATTQYEAGDLAGSYGSFSLQVVRPVIERVGESRTNDETAAAIAVALGFSAEEFDPSLETMAALARTDGRSDNREALRAGMSTLQFVDVHPAFSDGSSAARLTDPSSVLPVPRYAELPARKLTLLTPASSKTINSMFADTDPPELVVKMHRADAQARGIASGDLVRVFNDLGEIQITADVDDSVRPGVVSIAKGFWRRHFGGGLTSNALIPYGEADLGRNACFFDAQVEVAAR
jgi:anaerobic selenocysteine-containing dehydrogenase